MFQVLHFFDGLAVAEAVTAPGQLAILVPLLRMRITHGRSQGTEDLSLRAQGNLDHGVRAPQLWSVGIKEVRRWSTAQVHRSHG